MKNKNQKIQAIKGMKDILPDEAALWQEMESKARNVFERFNYREIRVPVCEKTDLFSRSIGGSTDIVEKEMFSFKDRNDESISLRPEGTASVVRACIENNVFIPGHLSKLYYIGPMFRYEKPQKGRQRQFHQIGAEVFGIDDPMLDVELILMCATFLKELGVSDFNIEINSMGDEETRTNYKKALVDFLNSSKKSFCDKCLERKDKNPLRVLDCKVVTCRQVLGKAPKITDFLSKAAKANFESVKQGLEGSKLNFTVNPGIVRGLDYYTMTVFEFTSTSIGAQNAILGGGRYNRLVEELGGQSTPASGFALGLERLLLIFKEKYNQPESNLNVYIANLDEKARKQAFSIASNLRDAGIKTDIDYSGKSLKSQLSKADKQKANFVIIIGEDEIKKDLYIVRNMLTKEQIESKRNELTCLIKSLIGEK